MTDYDHERDIYDHIQALDRVILSDLQEPLRSTMHSLCLTLSVICCPGINAAAVRGLYELEERRQSGAS